MMKQDIIMVSTNDWHGFWFQRQEFATRFALSGHRVFFINRIPQRIPSPARVIRWLKSNSQSRKIYNPVPEGVVVLSPRLLPPFRSLRKINKFLWIRFWNRFETSGLPVDPVVITYQPTYNVIDLISVVKAGRVVYINTHNYNEDRSTPKALLEAEKILVGRADVLMADSAHNVERLKRYRPSAVIHRAMPGVSAEKFMTAYRGDEAEKGKVMMFFGDIGRHLDVELYNRLAERFRIVFIGIADESVKKTLSGSIEVRPPVPSGQLPGILREADVLTIFYRKSSYVDNILPAKFFECIATLKPLMVSGLPETGRYGSCVYDIDGDPDKAVTAADNLRETETESVVNLRKEIAGEADWENRFRQFNERIFGK